MTSLTAAENLNNNPTVVGANRPGGPVQQLQQQQQQQQQQQKQANGHEAGDLILTQQFVEKVPNDVRVTPTTTPSNDQHQRTKNEVKKDSPTQSLEVRKLGDRRASSPFQNGRTELLIGAEDNKLKTTAIVESNNNKLGIDTENR